MSWSPILNLNSAAMPANDRGRSVWWRRNCAPARNGGCGADEFDHSPPFPIGADALFVAYYASAELGCFRALSWPMPANMLDLFVEFRNRTNGTDDAGAESGLHRRCCTYFGLDNDRRRREGRHARARPSRRSVERRRTQRNSRLLQRRRDALERLLPAMLPRIDLPRALLRGRYMKAAAAMEFNGMPIDTVTLALLREYWTDIQDELIAAIDADYGVFDGRTFKADRWAALSRHATTFRGRGSKAAASISADDAFRQMAKAYPVVSPMRELRSALSDLRLNDLAVGHDGRNRTILSAFRSRTGRNQPCNTKFIFGPSVWLRSLIKPPPGHGLAYIDWSQQEFGIAAALSGDASYARGLSSGDPYLAFAKQAGAVPADATKETQARRANCSSNAS